MKSVTHTMALGTLLAALGLLGSCGGEPKQSPKQSVPSLAITTGSLPSGVTGISYHQTVQATGGVGPFTWTISAGTLPHNLSLSVSSTSTVTISGTPDTGAQGVTFTVKVTDSSSQMATQPYTISVLLQADNLTLAPPSLDFGMQLVGITSTAQTETLTNTGTFSLALNSVAITGVNSSDFNEGTSTCGSTLTAGTDCSVEVGFTPSQLGPRAATLTITDDDVSSPQSVSITGTGVTTGPNATPSATGLGFANQLLDTTSPPLSITLSNYGTSVLDVATINSTTSFGETDNCIGSLASGASCTINVTFAPNTTGNIDGTLSITDDAPGSPQDIGLSGTGISGGKCVAEGGYCDQNHPCCSGLRCFAVGNREKCGTID
jgi:hypothetical protein